MGSGSQRDGDLGTAIKRIYNHRPAGELAPMTSPNNAICIKIVLIAVGQIFLAFLVNTN